MCCVSGRAATQGQGRADAVFRIVERILCSVVASSADV